MVSTDRPDSQRLSPRRLLTPARLRRQNLAFRGRCGISEENRSQGFLPAFLDTETGAVYRARYADGRQAPMHVLDGLPEELVLSRRPCGAVAAIKAGVVSGFLRDGRFFTREQATHAMQRETAEPPQ